MEPETTTAPTTETSAAKPAKKTEAKKTEAKKPTKKAEAKPAKKAEKKPTPPKQTSKMVFTNNGKRNWMIPRLKTAVAKAVDAELSVKVKEAQSFFDVKKASGLDAAKFEKIVAAVLDMVE